MNSISSLLNEEQINEAISKVQAKYTVQKPEDFLFLPSTEVRKLVNFSEDQMACLMQHITYSFVDTLTIAHHNASDMAKQKEVFGRKLSFGCPFLDQAFHKGIPTNGITELAGTAGSGKTQFCLQLAVQAQLPPECGGLGGKTLYISTEGQVPMSRFKAMVASVKRKYAPRFDDMNFEEGLLIHARASTAEGLLQLLQSQVPTCIQQEKAKNNKIGLLIVDSIAAPARSDFDLDETIQRSQLLWKEANLLKLLSSYWNIPVVVTNQVTELITNNEVQAFSGPKLIPALGLAWSNCITTRFMIERLDRTHNRSSVPFEQTKKFKSETTGSTADPVIVRKIQVVLSPELDRNSYWHFHIDTWGVRGLPDTN